MEASLRRTIWVLALLVLGMTVQFVVDIATPPGVADAIGYPALLVLTVWLPWTRALSAFTWLATVLTVIGSAFGTHGGIGYEASLINRGIALVGIWVMFVVLSHRRRLEQRIARSEQRAAAASQAHLDALDAIETRLRQSFDGMIIFAAVVARQGHGPVGSARYVEHAEQVYAEASELRLALRNALEQAKNSERAARALDGR